MISTLLSTTLFITAEAKAGQQPTPAHVVRQEARPWAVKAASDQIVNMCCFGYMWNGGSGSGGYTTAGGSPIAPAFSTISFSADTTESFETDTATTVVTTIPGGVVTVYSDSEESTVTNDSTDSTVTDATAAVLPVATPTGASNNLRQGFLAEFRAVESWAHNLAEAIIAPSSMTAVLEGVYNEVLDHGFIHPTKAIQLVNQASGALKQLETDPAYKYQRNLLKSQPTPAHFDIKRAVASVTSTHAAGLAKVTAASEGKQAFHNAKQLAEHFVKEFIH